MGEPEETSEKTVDKPATALRTCKFGTNSSDEFAKVGDSISGNLLKNASAEPMIGPGLDRPASKKFLPKSTSAVPSLSVVLIVIC